MQIFHYFKQIHNTREILKYENLHNRLEKEFDASDEIRKIRNINKQLPSDVTMVIIRTYIKDLSKESLSYNNYKKKKKCRNLKKKIRKLGRTDKINILIEKQNNGIQIN
ncbi:hypothetical protein U3516DRAFT_743140 [Neocallimastix sp. 'constans']